MAKQVIAVTASDVHLSHTGPVARAAEPDWYAAMARPLDEIAGLVAKYEAPLVVAGDIFDRWQAPPELINFALDCLPDCYAVAGQHDTPNHLMSEINRSAYSTLIRAGKIKPLDWHEPTLVRPKLMLHGFNWGQPPVPWRDIDGYTHLAVVHAYIWKDGCSYPGAAEEQRVGKYRKALKGYHAAVFGDNHKGFVVQGVPTIMNCGTLLRRKLDEIDYRPTVGLLYDDGSIEPHYLDVSKDLFIDAPLATREELDIQEFVEDLKQLGSDSLDFRAAIHQALDTRDVSSEVRTMVLEALATHAN